MRTSKALKTLGVFAVAVVFLALCNAAITFALEPYGSKSELVWTDYAAEEEIDTVIVGTSLMQHAINPYVLDEESGAKSYCLATPNQSLPESLIAIQTAYEDHGVKRAILGLSSVNVQDDDAPSLGGAFLRQRSRVVSPMQSWAAAAQVLLHYGGLSQRDSINAAFPWVFNHVKLNFGIIRDNIIARSTMTLREAAHVADPDWNYVGKGYGAIDTVLDYDDVNIVPYFEDYDPADPSSADVEVSAESARALADICAYCAERGIDLVVVTPPMPLYNVADGDAYFKLHDNVAAALAESGVDYYDFNFARPELFDAQPDYYFDYLHMNTAGGTAFTTSFARFLELRGQGEAVVGLFYSQDELLASIDRISAVFAEGSVEGDVVHVKARAAAGPALELEYQLRALDRDTGEWAAVSAWSDEPVFDYTPAYRGEVALQVAARAANAPADERHRYLSVFF